MNQGYWHYVEPKLRNILKEVKRTPEVHYAGRAPSASTATGYGKVHEAELKHFLHEAMKI